MNNASRRRFLRGMLDGAAITVCLPFLECFLNESGTALASGAALPVRFGTWFWGLGVNRPLFVPTKVGAHYDLPQQISSWRDIQQHVSLFTNFNVELDGRPNICHHTGWVAIRCGEAPLDECTYPTDSLDVTIADAISSGTRVRSLNLAANGNPCSNVSFRRTGVTDTPIVSPGELYKRIFRGGGDAGSLEGVDPRIMTRKSVLTGVMEQSVGLRRQLGAADRARLDEYFTATRELEIRLAQQLERAAAQCRKPAAAGPLISPEIDILTERHSLMADLLVIAIASNQSRIFNMLYSDPIATTTCRGTSTTHHTMTHEEAMAGDPLDRANSAWYISRAMESFAYFVKALASFKEGDRTLLDNSLVFAHTDVELAQTHSVRGIPVMLAGTAGGRIRGGIHVDGKAAPVTRVGLTAMRAMGLQVDEWGSDAMKTRQPMSEVLS